MMRRLFLLLLIALSISLTVRAQQPLPTSPSGTLTAADTYLRNERLGIAHISQPEGGTSPERYRAALSLGAGWNRYPIYWDRVESTQGEFDWSRFDRQVADDLGYGLDVLAILLGRPAFYADGDRIAGIQEPIYADGTDTPGEGKALNPDNAWVTFVHEAVTRYKPEGTLAQQGTLPTGRGVTHWEIWNEPDHKPFWSASIADYARLLKISYIVIKQADPNAVVLFGGLLYNTQANWLAQVLAIYIKDPQREANNWYMDAVAVHSYANPWRSGWLVLNVEQTLVAYALDKPIWITETGVPVWNDYPGQTWASTPDERLKHATLEQQARYYIQSAVYGWQEGADVVIFHQLFDDCGDKPPGTDFPPHDGGLCVFNENCFGDAHGMYRNLESSVCFSQHPQPGTPRPAADAYRLLAQVFNEPFGKGEFIYDPEQAGVIEIRFTRENGQRITVLWNQTFESLTRPLEAIGENAQLIRLTGETLITPNADGLYTLTLPPATPDDYPDLPFGAEAAIGGDPFIVIEEPDGRMNPFVRYTPPQTSGAVALPPSESRPTPVARPTVDPVLDKTPPTVRVNPLPVTSAETFTVSWSGRDDSGIEMYVVWVRADDGVWRTWLETPETSAEFQGVKGTRYAFDVWARDLAGNWSLNVELTPQAVTRVNE